MSESFIEELSTSLREAKIEHRVDKDCVVIPLPKSFGNLEISSLSDTEELIGLEAQEWHLCTSSLGAESSNFTSLEKVLHFVRQALAGNYFLIEEKAPGEEAIRLIEDDLEAYKSELSDEVEFKVIFGN